MKEVHAIIRSRRWTILRVDVSEAAAREILETSGIRSDLGIQDIERKGSAWVGRSYWLETTFQKR